MGHPIAVKLFWLWISFLITVLAFWRVRMLWIRHHPKRKKYLRYRARLAKRLKDRRKMLMEARKAKPVHKGLRDGSNSG